MFQRRTGCWTNDEGGRKEPYAVKTLLGWTLLGPIGSESQHEFQVNFVQSENGVLQRQVERMM